MRDQRDTARVVIATSPGRHTRVSPDITPKTDLFQSASNRSVTGSVEKLVTGSVPRPVCASERFVPKVTLTSVTINHVKA